VIEPLTNTIQGVVNFTWPMIIISVVVIVSCRLSYIIKNKDKERFVFYKELLMLSFIIYILCLFQVVTFQDDVSWASNNFIPFNEIFRYSITSRLFIKNVIGNMLMFLPFGFFISYYLNNEKVWLTLFITVITSLAIELVQLTMIGRVFDVDDIILNVIGGVAGFYIYHLLSYIGDKVPSVFKSEWFLNIVSVIILIGVIILI
jgi:glycopeptide antibiotics resistance protein